MSGLPENAMEIAVKAVKEAGLLIKNLQTESIVPQFKWDSSPVTIADKQAEILISKTIRDHFPGCGFSGEETGEIVSENGYSWACDPLDGTWSYLNRELTCAICLSLHKDGQTKLAVIYNPFTDELFTGSSDHAPTLNGRKLPLCAKKSLDESVINYFIQRSKTEQVAFLYQLRKEKVINKLVSLGGSIAYALACVAKGSHQGFVGLSGRSSKIWDMAAGKYLIEACGGKVTDLHGVDLPPDFPAFTTLIAGSNPEIHEEIRRLLLASGCF